MRCDSLIDEHVLDEAIDRYVAWREECNLVRDAYERWMQASGTGAASAFADYQAALDREGHVAEVYGNLMARVVIAPGPRREPTQEPVADDRPEHGVVWYAVAWVGVLAISAALTAVVLSMAVGTGGIQ